MPPPAQWVQASLNAGYFLFPHQTPESDSLKLQPFCYRNGHPGPIPEPWDALSKRRDHFEDGQPVVIHQSGFPRWLTGIWGYGSIEKNAAEVRVRSDRLLPAPLFLSAKAAKKLRTKFLRRLLLGEIPSYQGTYASVAEDFEYIRGLIEQLEPIPVKSIRKENRPDWLQGSSGKRVFEDWAKREGYELVTRGFPDVLATTPNRRLMAFEGKDGSDGPSAYQLDTFSLLKSKGLSIRVVQQMPNEAIARELEEAGWETISVGRVTRGWPDYLLVDRSRDRVIACELKTGLDERVSPDQIKTLSALSTFLGVETHVIRVVPDRDREVWALYDDSERWLLYPPRNQALH